MIPKILRGFQAFVIGIITFIIVFPAIIGICYHFVYQNKIYPRIKIANLPTGRLSKKEAFQLLAEEINNKGLEELLFKQQNQTWIINLKELNFQYLPQQTVEKAFSYGRSGSLKNNLWQKWQIWKTEINFTLDYQLDQQLLEQKIASISALINKPVIPPTIEITTDPDRPIKINQGHPGKTVNQDKLKQLVDSQITTFDKKTITLPVKNTSSSISRQQMETTEKRAYKLLDKKVELSFNNNHWQITDKEIINFLDFEGGFSQEKIASHTARLAKLVDRPPQNALFKFLPDGQQESQGRVVEFKTAQQGQQLNQEKTTQLLIEAFQGLEKEENQSATVHLPVALSQPDIATKDANNLGIKELIGQGQSWFRSSTSSRIHNIELASKRLDGLLIPPGETFSFNKSLGEVSAQTGFKQAYIIKEGKTVLDDGGGVCQVSTTLFRAALKSGLPIIERRAHAYRVSYYEQNYQPGVDATVFAPTTDLKFKNDTPGHILIQTLVNKPSYKLIFLFYGSADGRQINLSESRVWDQTPPPPDVYQDDPTLPAGTVKQVDWKAWGAKVAFDWKVTLGNQVLQERTFYSHYKPWQAVYLKGTGGQ